MLHLLTELAVFLEHLEFGARFSIIRIHLLPVVTVVIFNHSQAEV